MASAGGNEGFTVLEEFVCEALHALSTPLASPSKQGQNDGMSVLDELTFDIGEQYRHEEEGKNAIVINGVDQIEIRSAKQIVLAKTEVQIESQIDQSVEVLACYIAASVNPLATMLSVQKILVQKLEHLNTTASRHVGNENVKQ